jgi:hypothetical protein
MIAGRMPHIVAWDDQHVVNQMIDPGEMMRRLAGVLDAEFAERSFRGEPRYELRCGYPGGFELVIVAGHLYDTREVLSMSVELWAVGMSRPLAAYHLSNGLQRVKVSGTTAWFRATNGTVLIVGEGLGGLIEVQN